MKEYVIPDCVFFRAGEDVITASGIDDAGAINMDDPGNSAYGKIYWKKN